VPQGVGNHHPSIAPYGTFTASDGVVQIAVGSEGCGRSSRRWSGLDPADERYATNALRVARKPELVAHIDAAFAAQPMAHWLPLLARIGVPGGGGAHHRPRVRLGADPLARGCSSRSTTRALGPISLPGPPLRFDGGAPPAATAPPVLGQHDESVRRWLADGEAGSDRPPSDAG
jgi:crotonobetainyl-CoA:carnitine CoA-transferase CaiB-like acyl-CoA transferase